MTLFLEFHAECAVDLREVFGTETLTIGRIGDDGGFFATFGEHEIADISLLKCNEFVNTGCFCVGLCSFDGAQIEIESVDLVIEFSLVAVVIEDIAEEFGIEIFPVFKGKLTAENAGIDVARHKCGFNKNGSRTAEWIDEIAIEVPTAHFDNGCCQHFVDGCFHRGFAITTKM